MLPSSWIHVHVEMDGGHSLMNLLLHSLRDVVGLGQGCVRWTVDVQNGDQLTSHPAGTYVVHAEHS